MNYSSYIQTGIYFDKPNVKISWQDSIQDMIQNTLNKCALKKITDQYYVLSDMHVFDSLISTEVGLHIADDKIYKVEFFRKEVECSLKKSYDEYQKSLEVNFGSPNITKKGICGFKSYKWKIGKVEIIHGVYDRFGEEEHAEIIYHK